MHDKNFCAASVPSYTLPFALNPELTVTPAAVMLAVNVVGCVSV